MSTTELTLAQVAVHNSKDDIHIIIHDKVYDVTQFLNEHPGGPEILIDVAGQDCSEAYDDAGHSDEAHEILPSFQVGVLRKDDPKPSKEPSATGLVEAEKPVKDTTVGVLKPGVFQQFKLDHKTEISHNVAIYRFKLPTEDSILGLPCGQHISVGAVLPQPDQADKEVVRSYTPISSDHQKGFFDLLVKTYPQGLISSHLASLKLGDEIRVRGPKGGFTYTKNMVRRFGMIAGGTGLTPMLQIILEILRGRKDGDDTEVDLIFANVNEDDILLKKDLEDLAEMDDGIRIFNVLNNPPKGWAGGAGFVNADHISQMLPKPADDIKILLCGPPPMVSAMKKITEALGYEKARPVSKLEDQVFTF